MKTVCKISAEINVAPSRINELLKLKLYGNKLLNFKLSDTQINQVLRHFKRDILEKEKSDSLVVMSFNQFKKELLSEKIQNANLPKVGKRIRKTNKKKKSKPSPDKYYPKKSGYNPKPILSGLMNGK